MKIQTMMVVMVLLAGSNASAQTRDPANPDLAELRQLVAQLQARIVVLEDKTHDIHREPTDDGAYYLQIDSRVGIQSNFWARKSRESGAALSIGAVEPLGIYVELEPNPTTGLMPSLNGRRAAFYAAVLGAELPGEETQNIGMEVHVAHSRFANLPFYGDYTQAGSSQIPNEGLRLVDMTTGVRQKTVSISGDGITLLDGQQAYNEYFIKKLGGSLSRLWSR